MTQNISLERKHTIDLILRRILLFGAIISVIWCCYEYAKNEDMCEVNYRRFLETDEYVYPDLTVILPIQVNETKLKLAFGKDINASFFQGILFGYYWDDRIMDVDVDDVSLPLSEYMISHCVWSSFYQNCTALQKIITWREFGSVYHTYRLPINKKTAAAAFQFRSSVFSNGLHPNPHELMMIFQYPNRIYRAHGSLFDGYWRTVNGQTANRRITFNLKDLEVLRRRNKRSDGCTEIPDYDSKIKEVIYNDVGCRPFYVNNSNVKEICSSKEQMQNLSERLLSVFHRFSGSEIGVPPCTEVQRIQMEYLSEPKDVTTREEITSNYLDEIERINDTWFEIRYDIKTDTFKEIKQNRAYSAQSLIGNVGGYLGLLVGFSFIDMIDAFTSILAKLKKLFSFA